MRIGELLALTYNDIDLLKEYISHLNGIMADERMFRFTKSHMEHEKIETTLFSRREEVETKILATGLSKKDDFQSMVPLVR